MQFFLSRWLRAVVPGLLLGASFTVNAQTESVGIGTTTPDASAVLELSTTNKGLLLPRLTMMQRDAIQSPAAGLMIYQTDNTPGLYLWGGSSWSLIPTATQAADNLGNHTATQNLDLNGQLLVSGGTSGIGIGSTGNVGLGLPNPSYPLHVRSTTNEVVEIQSSSTDGTWLGLTNTGTNGRQWQLISSATGNGEGAGKLLIRDGGTGAIRGAFDTDGYFGVGTGSPQARLHVQGGARITDLGGNGTRMLTAGPNGDLSSTDLPTDAQQLSISGTTLSISGGNSVSLSGAGDNLGNHTATQNLNLADRLLVGGTAASPGASGLSVNSAGNVGIGTNNAVATLHVSGGSSTVRLDGLAGTGTRVVTADADGDLSTVATESLADNLGNHTATQALDLAGNALTGSGASLSAVGVGVRADGGLNLGQNTAGNSLAIGYQAGQSNDITGSDSSTPFGHYNQFVGYQAGRANTSGFYNHFSGYRAGYANTDGTGVTAVGALAGYNNTGSGNLFVGASSGFHTSSGIGNSFVGGAAGFYNTTGANNTAVGAGAGPASGSTGLTNTTALGYNARVSQSNSLVLGGTDADAVRVGIGTAAPAATLHVESGDVAATAPGDVPASPAAPAVSGAGRRLLWYPDKAAFRAGYVDGTQWDQASVGRYSFAAGANAIASGEGAFAGSNSTATSLAAVALGAASATGDFAVALGGGSVASGYSAVALGSSIANGDNAVAAGRQTAAAGDQSVGLGTYARATHQGAFVLSDSYPIFLSQALTSAADNQLTARFTGGYRFFTDPANTTGLHLTTAGYVGVNTAAPAATLHVAGAASTVRLEGLAGTGTRVVTADADGELSTVTTTSLADNLGDHIATQNLDLQANTLTGTGASISGVGVGVTSAGGLNVGQNTSGNDVYIGYQAGNSLNFGNANHYVGYQAGATGTVGIGNHFEGYQAGRAATGTEHHFSGHQAGELSSGTQNTFIGYQAGQSASGAAHLFVGYQAGQSNTGTDNVFIGHRAGRVNQGSSSLFVGNQAGAANTSGTANLFVGTSAGSNNITGSGNWAFGHNAGPSIDGLSNAGAIGYGATVSQSNSLAIGNGSLSVGIGTGAPQATLHVEGSTRLTGLAGTGTRVVTTDNDGDLAATVVNISSTGQVGIGSGISAPGVGGQFGNTATATVGVDGVGSTTVGSATGTLAWAINGAGYAATLYNGGVGGSGNGLAIKVNGTTAGASALDISKGAAQATAGTALFAVGSSRVDLQACKLEYSIVSPK